ncbi:MAG: elongation factor P [Candidatus Izemoplasmatales bacterium]|nr:elongation factor P [Candidatus Izemoplasmatales bacterium]
MVSTNDFKTGLTIEVDGNLFQVIEFQHVKPGKGGAFVRSKLRNLRSGAILDKTFNAGVNVNTAMIEKNAMQYLYQSGDVNVFMNMDTYEQIELPSDRIQQELQFLTEGMTINIISYEHEILGLELPDKVTLEVVETAGGARGNTASNATKEAITNTGYKLLVPLFIETGEKIVVSTATGKYDTRAK